jgi:hypothetical protein
VSGRWRSRSRSLRWPRSVFPAWVTLLPWELRVRAQLFRPADLRLDRQGNLDVADVRNHRVRRSDARACEYR